MDSETRTELEARIQRMIVDRLKLEREPDSIDPTESLFGDDGLGLDSIDALELVLGVEREFDVSIDDEEMGTEALASVRSLAEYIATRRSE